MLSYDEALDLIAALPLHGRRETVPLVAAAGRVLAEPVALDRDQPGFDRATMDGYAVGLEAGRDTYTVLGTIHAGEDSTLAPPKGEAVRIMTGAPCPPGVTVVPIELTDEGTVEVRITDPSALAPGRNIAWRGEDGRAGDLIAAAGQRLGPVVLSAIAMAGATEVAVHGVPRVAVVTTGDEVGGAGRAGIRDSNGPLLVALVEALGAAVARHHARDDLESLRVALSAGRAAAEVVVTTGGVSMGAKDLVPAVAGELGYETVFHKVAMQPGKPVLLCRHPEGGFLVGLPGNPVSVLATAHLVLAPLLGRMLGGWMPSWLELPLAVPFAHRKNRRLFLPARLGDGGVHPVAWNGSGDLLAASAADGLMDVAPGMVLAAGERVRFLPYFGSRPGEGGVLPPRAKKELE